MFKLIQRAQIHRASLMYPRYSLDLSTPTVPTTFVAQRLNTGKMSTYRTLFSISQYFVVSLLHEVKENTLFE